MFNSRVHRGAVWLLRLLLLDFLILKIVQVKCELGTTGSWGLAIQRGLGRRLDDPSFWMVLACLLATQFIGVAVVQMTPSPSDVWPVKRRDILVWLASALILSLTYVAADWHNHEAWFTNAADPSIRAIQHVEGYSIVAVIAVTTMFFAVALRCLDEICETFSLNPKSDAARQSAAMLASAGVGPFISGGLAYFLWSLGGFLLGKPDFFGSTSFQMVVGSVLLFASPFFYLRWLVGRRLGGCLELKFRYKFEGERFVPPPFDVAVAGLGLADVRVGGHYEALWRNAETGCRCDGEHQTRGFEVAEVTKNTAPGQSD